jgi:hypothetical protein
MTRARFWVLSTCLGVIAALALATARPAWAEEYSDPTITSDGSDETPEGLRNLGDAQTAKRVPPTYDTPPIYTNWWFWAGSAALTAALVFLAVTPLTPKAASCGGGYELGCFGDGRSAQ